MISNACTARCPVIDNPYPFHQSVQQVFQLLLGAGAFQFQFSTLLKKRSMCSSIAKYLIVAHWASVIHAIAKPMNAIVHWDAIRQGPNFPL